MSAGKDGAMHFVQHLRDWCSNCVAFSQIDGSESRSHLTWGITYISGFRIFSALEVAGDVFSRADVGQQLVELRRRAL
jgi:hypothetical protein